MPSIRDSQARGSSGITPGQITNPIKPVSVQTPVVNSPVTPDTQQVSGFMLRSMPPVAAGGDIYTRQFYRSGLPQRRFLPVAL
jgi:hypothetical protein